MSPKSTSLMSPSETRWEKPMPRAVAQSSTVVTIAPDCATKATPPFCGVPGANDAFIRIGVEMTPRQFGPTTRNKCGRAASSIAFCNAIPAALPPSWKPAVTTMAAFVPRAPNSAMRGGTVCGGVQMTARSGVSGRDFTSG